MFKSTGAMLGFAMLLLTCGSCGQQNRLDVREAFLPDQDGFIRHWLILAPIPVEVPSVSVETEQVPGEASLEPAPGDRLTIDGKQLIWKPIVAREYYFDVNELLGQPVKNAAGYAVTYVESPQEVRNVIIGVCSDDDCRLYLNGTQVYKFIGPRISGDTDYVENITLRQGTNVVVFKVLSESNNWRGCLCFLDQDGRPVPGVSARGEVGD